MKPCYESDEFVCICHCCWGCCCFANFFCRAWSFARAYRWKYDVHCTDNLVPKKIHWTTIFDLSIFLFRNLANVINEFSRCKNIWFIGKFAWKRRFKGKMWLMDCFRKWLHILLLWKWFVLFCVCVQCTPFERRIVPPKVHVLHTLTPQKTRNNSNNYINA